MQILWKPLSIIIFISARKRPVAAIARAAAVAAVTRISMERRTPERPMK
jgi:hypothetical protein